MGFATGAQDGGAKQAGTDAQRCGLDHKDVRILINNRQSGRRRGRNNPRVNTGGNRGGGDSANRIDNRSRGNAPQMLEKYKNMARDAQMQDDRVQAEYYLQFADHYFRVMNDQKLRQEEAQAQNQGGNQSQGIARTSRIRPGPAAPRSRRRRPGSAQPEPQSR